MRRDDRKPRRGQLSSEDKELWTRVTRTLDPLTDNRLKPLKPKVEEKAKAEAEKPTKDGVADGTKPGPKKTIRLGNLSKPAAPIGPRSSGLPSVSSIDRQSRRRIARGTIGIDARIDLHGMTQREAHMRLRGFLLTAQAQGHRHVLVITGKGRSGGGFGRDDERGVLKRSVPYWLSHGEFRELVAAIEEAHFAHGGTGAYYVRLRRRRGGKS
ncbi:MAG: DNA mismatch repair protein MutS [Hyphomicrobiales bacterium]|nr:MAG: DNA mismatch repair protein MutS [Hyphomicrobiales bacterium]